MSRPTTPTKRAPQFAIPPQSDEDDSSSPYSPSNHRHPEVEDPNYSPRAEQWAKRPLIEKWTPAKRRKTASSVATYAIKNAVDAFRVATHSTPPRSLAAMLDHYHGEVPCLISREQRELGCVETCHVIRKAVDYKVLDTLEWVWGFKYFSMNVDTRYNLIHLNAVLHGAFDRNGWFLLPVDTEILGELRRVTRKQPLKLMIHEIYKGKKTFQYKFIPLPPMNGLSISRYEGDYTTEPGPRNTTLHFYPFSELPVIESHVYPHYIIYDLGEKLKHLFGEDLDQEPIPSLSFGEWAEGLGGFYDIETFHLLYRTWMKITPPSWYIQGKDSDDNVPDRHGAGGFTARSDAGSRAMRANTRSQTSAKDGNRAGTGAGATSDGRPSALDEGEPFHPDPADNSLFPSDSVSCRDDLSQEGDDGRCGDGEHDGDGDSGLSDSSWINDLEAWRVRVHTAVREEEYLEAEDTVSSTTSGRSSRGSFSDSSTMFERAAVGSTLNDSCADGAHKVKQEDSRALVEAEPYLGPKLAGSGVLLSSIPPSIC